MFDELIPFRYPKTRKACIMKMPSLKMNTACIGKSFEMYPGTENQRSYKVLILHQTRFFDERSHLQLLNVEQFVCWLVGEIKQPSLSRKKVNRCRGGHFHTWESIGGRSVNYIVLLHNYKQSLCMNDLPNDFNSNGGILIHSVRYQILGTKLPKSRLWLCYFMLRSRLLRS